MFRQKKLIIFYSHSYITHIISIFCLESVIEMCMFFSFWKISQFSHYFAMIILAGVDEKNWRFTNNRGTGAFDDLSCKYFLSFTIFEHRNSIFERKKHIFCWFVNLPMSTDFGYGPNGWQLYKLYECLEIPLHWHRIVWMNGKLNIFNGRRRKK